MADHGQGMERWDCVFNPSTWQTKMDTATMTEQDLYLQGFRKLTNPSLYRCVRTLLSHKNNPSWVTAITVNTLVWNWTFLPQTHSDDVFTHLHSHSHTLPTQNQEPFGSKCLAPGTRQHGLGMIQVVGLLHSHFTSSSSWATAGRMTGAWSETSHGSSVHSCSAPTTPASAKFKTIVWLFLVFISQFKIGKAWQGGYYQLSAPTAPRRLN